MSEIIVSFFSGAIFAIGLGISGMTQPAKVTAFLDFFGEWDPSLLFVMGGAILVYAIGYRFILKRNTPFFSGKFHLPTLKKIDRPLLLGSMLFGMGWGLAGFCPGPALASVVTLSREPLIFVVSMIAGMNTYALVSKKRRAK